MHKHLDSDLTNLSKSGFNEQAIADYITAMSHDLKTPLVAIVGIGEILKGELKAEEHQKLLATLTNATNTVLSLVRDILSLTHLDSGHLQVLFEPFDLLRLIEEVVSTQSYQSLEKNVEIFISYPSHLPKVVVGDLNSMRRIMINLLNNAIKLTNQGHIEIQVTSESLTTEEAKLNIKMIAPTIHIATTYFNNESSLIASKDPLDQQLQQEVNLTLTIVKSLLRGMNAQFNLLTDNIGKMEYHCSIPFALKKIEAAQQPQGKVVNLKILLISDNTRYRTLIQEAFENKEIESCHSSDCLKILENSYLKNDFYDIVLVESSLINPTLISVAHKAKRDKWIQKTLFMYLSFPLSLTQVEHVKLAGFHDTLFKPILPSKIYEQVYNSWKKHIEAQIQQTAEVHHDEDNRRRLHQRNPIKKHLSTKYNILLVEDNLIAGNITQTMLSGLDCNVDWVENGVDALRLCKTQSYDLIFLDIDLPDIDGITICRILRSTEGGFNQGSIIVALTGQIAQKEAGSCLAAGMNAFLEKPASLANFREIIKNYLPPRHHKNAA